jgi:hypothetical protein
MPAGYFPAGFLPAGLFPAAYFPATAPAGGAASGGYFPPGTFPAGCFPAGYFPGATAPAGGAASGGYFPPGTFPAGCFPPGYFPGATAPAPALPPISVPDLPWTWHPPAPAPPPSRLWPTTLLALAATGTARGAAPVGTRRLRPDVAARAIADLLYRTGLVPLVEAVDDADDVKFLAQSDASEVAAVWSEAWTEMDDAASGTEADVVHASVFHLAILVRDGDFRRRRDRLARLVEAAKNAVDGSDLGGVAFPAFTKIRAGRRLEAPC